MKTLITTGSIAIFAILVFVGYKISQVSVQPVHYHANFAAFVDGTQIDFTKPELMHIKPCTDADEFSTDPRENVHLHDQIGNVVHVHAENISWNLFFSTIKFDVRTLSEGKSLTVYSKGKKVSPDVLSQTITTQDQLLIHIASQSGSQSTSDTEELQKEERLVGENSNEYDNGKVGVEKCGAEGKRTFYQRFKIAFGL